MSYYSDPTANAAIGTVDREIRRLRKRAEQIRRRRQKGFLTKQEEEDARREFVGIYRRFLLEALEDHV
jgi:hypothetical protein